MPRYLSKFSYTADTWARLVGNPEDRQSHPAPKSQHPGPSKPEVLWINMPPSY